jgi:hypothetical protein
MDFLLAQYSFILSSLPISSHLISAATTLGNINQASVTARFWVNKKNRNNRVVVCVMGAC